MVRKRILYRRYIPQDSVLQYHDFDHAMQNISSLLSQLLVVELLNELNLQDRRFMVILENSYKYNYFTPAEQFDWQIQHSMQGRTKAFPILNMISSSIKDFLRKGMRTWEMERKFIEHPAIIGLISIYFFHVKTIKHFHKPSSLHDFERIYYLSPYTKRSKNNSARRTSVLAKPALLAPTAIK